MSDKRVSHFGRGAMTAPLGFLKKLENKLAFCVVDLTDDENDKELGALKNVQMTAAQNAKEDEAQPNKALMFSHTISNPQDIFKLKQGITFNQEMRTRADVRGVIFDKHSADEMAKGDVFFDVEHDSGNIISAYIMPKGWNHHYAKNQLCNECGAFPAKITCPVCTCGKFCSNHCFYKARRGDSHSKKICDAFVKGKVAASYIRQYNQNTLPEEQPKNDESSDCESNTDNQK